MDVLSAVDSTLLNASRSGRGAVILSPRTGSNSRTVRNLLRLLVREGYLEGLSPSPSSTSQESTVGLAVRLKYNARGEPAIRGAFRVSKPSRRVYAGVSSLWQPPAGAGLLVISTPRGLRSDRDARRFNVGGEILMGIR